MEYIIEIVVAVALVLLTRYAIPALQQYIDSKKAAELVSVIEQLVAAAEQLYPDPQSGSQKLDYVQTLLMGKGVELTDTIRASIEAAVYKLQSK